MTRRFRTNYTAQGRPYASDHWYEVDGFTWMCRGCDTRGSVNAFGDPYLPNERQKAHDDANDHATACRSMPRPAS